MKGPDKSFFSLGDRLDTPTATKKASSFTDSRSQATETPVLQASKSSHLPDLRSCAETCEVATRDAPKGDPQDRPEQVYLRKAAEYLVALPCKPGDSTYIIKTAAVKLHEAYAMTDLQTEVEKLRARFSFAITTCVNKKLRNSPVTLAADLVKQILRDNSGGLLQLCIALAQDGYIRLDNLEQTTQLCQSILDVLPKAHVSTVSDQAEDPRDAETSSSVEPIASAASSKKISNDPVEKMQGWPTQEKREHGTSKLLRC